MRCSFAVPERNFPLFHPMELETNRRIFIQSGAALASLSLFDLHRLLAAEGGVPQTVTELWADFDPRRDPIETEVIREW